MQNGAINQSDELVRNLELAVDEALRDESWVSFVNTFEIEAINREYRIAQESHEEGVAIGRAEGRVEEINALAAEGLLTPEQAAERIARIQNEETAKLSEFCA